MKKITKSHWLDLISSPFVLALPIVIGIILLLPDIFQKYIITQTYSGKADKPNSIEEYRDLNNDGYSERVVAFPNEFGFASVKVLQNDDGLVDQWNFSGKYPAINGRFCCADLNADSLMEIYVFTVSGDTLYLNAFDPMGSKGFIFRDKPVSVIGKYNDKIDIRPGWSAVSDLDGDGFNELLFNVHAGFSKQPRGIFAYNARLDTIIRSPVSGANINKIIITDMNNDGKPELFCGCSTLGNIHDTMGIPYSDYSSWFMGFDNNLQFLFPPVKFDAYPSYTSLAVIKSGKKKRIALLFRNRNKSNPPSIIALFNGKGEIIRKKEVTELDIPYHFHPHINTINYKGKQVIMIQRDKKTILLVDTLFRPLKTLNNFKPKKLEITTDLNGDGWDEFIYRGDNYSFIITQADFKNPVVINTDYEPFSKLPLCFSIKKNGNKLPELFIKPGNKAFLE